MALFAKPRTVVGLDIGSSAVKAVEVKPAGKGYKVTAFGTEPVPPDAMRERPTPPPKLASSNTVPL
jgi:Tfp pilus assembly PilM family ATPase